MTLDLKQTATSFYDAVATGDRHALGELLLSSFAENASLTRPESLPGGGALEGRDRILRFMDKAAGKAPLEVVRIEVNDAGTEVFAHVEITLAGHATSALEWWSSVDDQVVSIRAFYWDTAAMMQVL